MFKLIAIVAASIAMLGCASVGTDNTNTAAICKPQNRAELVRKNAEVIQKQQQIERYKAGEYINGENTSAVGRDGLIDFLQRKLNKDIRILTAHTDTFNRTCT